MRERMTRFLALAAAVAGLMVAVVTPVRPPAGTGGDETRLLPWGLAVSILGVVTAAITISAVAAIQRERPVGAARLLELAIATGTFAAVLPGLLALLSRLLLGHPTTRAAGD